MNTLVDTDILIDHLREHPAAVALIQRTTRIEQRLFASVVTKAELHAGLREPRGRTSELIASIEWVPVNDDIAEHAGKLAREHPRSDLRFAIADYLIAATAQLIGADLLTRNVRHFPMFPGLEAPYAL